MYRGLALFNQALGAQYNKGTGTYVPGSMTPEYFDKGLHNLYMQTEENMKERGCGVIPLGVLEERMNVGVVGALEEVCIIRVIYRVTKEEFKVHQLTLSKVKEKGRI